MYALDQLRTFLISQKALIVEGNKLLVLETTPNRNNGQPAWELPGGLLELDESMTAGLLRKVREETGLLVAIGRIMTVWDYWTPRYEFRDGRVLDVRIIGTAFQCQRINGVAQLSSAHRRFAWLANEELRQLHFSLNSKFAVDRYLAMNTQERSRA